MFGFIKMLNNLMTKLKQNKRLWFTTVFIVACAGISLALFMLVSTTDNISKEVYASQTQEFVQTYKDLEKLQEIKLQEISMLASYDTTLIQALQDNNIVSITKIEESIQAKLTQKNQNTLSVKFYSAQNTTEKLRSSVVSALQTKNNIFGIEVLFDGVFYVYLSPIIKDNVVIGIVEAKESIYSVKNSFDRRAKEFTFLLDKKMLPFLSLKNRDGVYSDIGKNHIVNIKMHGNKIVSYISALDDKTLEDLTKENYISDKEYFLNSTIIRDINGVDIGLVILGESISQDSSFINMVQKMANQVVMITLGLIVSLLLFLL
ncbi:hypothetical protein M947_10690 [Sulfurimonas hongkongensis]|uniref:Double Cache domain-containing protein n=1 Tax=Sulfurimonas hongkongensis TaxID=1172190 RepID=T0J080_9BACT|nr:hypothetical protein [Sulfurimonas hongkongensis]EQB34465.1 hypothetical protein M947_10690 [Sulfurimonas hongkongensis]